MISFWILAKKKLQTVLKISVFSPWIYAPKSYKSEVTNGGEVY